MKKSIFTIPQEPIFGQILSNMVLGQVMRLKKKARIKISDGIVLIGVPDPLGLLEEGEIFL